MQRLGRRHRPFYRINAVDVRTRRNGKVLENLGHYNPMDPDASKQVVLKEEKIKAWIERGAQPSETVMDMLGNAGMLDGAMKAEWEKAREVARQRGQCRAAVRRAEEAAKAIDGVDTATPEQVNQAKKAVNMAKLAVAPAKVAEAEKAASDAEAALKAAQASKPAPAPEPEAEPAAE
jgi:small subunit ribosomal protein S16